MFRKPNLKEEHIAQWLEEKVTNVTGRYTHRLITENGHHRASIIMELIAYVDRAHGDARYKLKKACSPSLSPFKDGATSAENLPPGLEGYPGSLPDATLLSYFGECYAALIVQYRPIGGRQRWVVPALFFRFHDAAFHRLEALSAYEGEEKAESGSLIGHHGNDVLAFQFSDENSVIGVAVCESKCLSRHNSTKSAEALQQLSSQSHLRYPTGLMDLLGILADYMEDETASLMHAALLEYRTDTTARPERVNVVAYTVGNSPTSPKSRETWFDRTKSPDGYSSVETLEVIETHFAELKSLVDLTYRGDE